MDSRVCVTRKHWQWFRKFQKVIQHPTGWIFCWLKKQKLRWICPRMPCGPEPPVTWMAFGFPVRSFKPSSKATWEGHEVKEDLQMENFSSPQNKTAQINLSKCECGWIHLVTSLQRSADDICSKYEKILAESVTPNLVKYCWVFYDLPYNGKTSPTHLSGRNLTWQRLLDRGTGCPWGLNSKTLQP